MRWVVEYYEQADATQPAEEFEVSLKRHHKKLGAKLRSIAALPRYLISTKHLITGEITSILIR